MEKSPEVLISILIATTGEREWYRNRITFNLLSQGVNEKGVEVLFNLDNKEKTIGQKRNELLFNCKGKYFCFIDDDDEVTPIYVNKLIQAANSGADCASLLGQYYLDGVYDRVFTHNLNIKAWYSDDKYHYRCPNHLNLIKKELVHGIEFDAVNFGEDGKWSMAINDQQRLKSQYEIKEMLYHYYHRTKK